MDLERAADDPEATADDPERAADDPEATADDGESTAKDPESTADDADAIAQAHDEEAEAEAAATAGEGAGEAAEAGDVPLLTNGQLAQVFHDIGDLLEVKGELVFKTVAYHRAADAIGRSPIEVARAYREGRPPDIPGVGKAIADKLAELATTGRSEYREKLLA